MGQIAYKGRLSFLCIIRCLVLNHTLHKDQFFSEKKKKTKKKKKKKINSRAGKVVKLYL